MEKNIDYKKEFDLACEKLAKQEKKIEKLNAEKEILEHKVKFLEGELNLYQKLHEKSISVEGEPDLYEDVEGDLF